MNTVTLSVASRETINQRALAASEGKPQGSHISFATVELLWQTLTKKRWEILHAMTGKGAMSIREAARIVNIPRFISRLVRTIGFSSLRGAKRRGNPVL